MVNGVEKFLLHWLPATADFCDLAKHTADYPGSLEGSTIKTSFKPGVVSQAGIPDTWKAEEGSKFKACLGLQSLELVWVTK